MAHRIVGVQKTELGHRHQGHSHDHSHFHDHAHGEAASAERWATFWLYWTLAGGLLVLTSYWVQWFSPVRETVTESGIKKEYVYEFHMNLAAGVGALLLSIRIIWHALKNLL